MSASPKYAISTSAALSDLFGRRDSVPPTRRHPPAARFARMPLIEEFLKPLGITQVALAEHLGVPAGGGNRRLARPEEYEAMRAAGNPLIESAEREGKVLYERPAA